MTRLDLDPTLVTRARELAARAAQPVIDLALWATTDTLSAVLSERARPASRLLLVDGIPIGDLS